MCLGACTYDKLPTLDPCLDNVSINVLNITPSTCDQSSGGFTVEITGDDSSLYTFQVGNQGQQASGVFSNLEAGTYQIIAQKGNCEIIGETIIENLDGLNAIVESTPSSCNNPTGTITLEVSGASGQTSILLDGSQEIQGNVFTQVSAGPHTVSITDESGCNLSIDVDVKSDVDYETVESIVMSSCALSGCHAGNVSPDFRLKSNIISRASRIFSRTSAGSMPPRSSGIALSDDEIAAIACWFADGAPE